MGTAPAKGRQQKAETHYRCKLTLEQVREIRADTKLNLGQLSRKYGISRGGILHVKRGVTWKE